MKCLILLKAEETGIPAKQGGPSKQTLRRRLTNTPDPVYRPIQQQYNQLPLITVQEEREEEEEVLDKRDLQERNMEIRSYIKTLDK